MAHCEKIKLCDVARVSNEISREYTERGRYKNNVDLSRYDLNYSIRNIGMEHFPLNDNRCMSAKRITTRTQSFVDECTYRKRKDTVGLCSWVVTCPQELVGNAEKETLFFDTVYKFALERYGEDSVVAGVVHNDETTPHIHIPCVPVIHENGKKRLSAKEFMNKAELQGFQRDLDKECEKVFGMPKLILNGRTKGDYTLSELQERTRNEQELYAREITLQERETSLRARETSLRTREEELEELEEQYKAKMLYAEQLCKFAGVKQEERSRIQQTVSKQVGYDFTC